MYSAIAWISLACLAVAFTGWEGDIGLAFPEETYEPSETGLPPRVQADKVSNDERFAGTVSIDGQETQTRYGMLSQALWRRTGLAVTLVVAFVFLGVIMRARKQLGSSKAELSSQRLKHKRKSREIDRLKTGLKHFKTLAENRQVELKDREQDVGNLKGRLKHLRKPWRERRAALAGRLPDSARRTGKILQHMNEDYYQLYYSDKDGDKLPD